VKIPVLFFGVFLFMASPCLSQAEDILSVGGFTGLGPVGEVAEGKPDNRQEAITILGSAGEHSLAQARRTYEQAVDPRFGLIPSVRIERSGLKRIIQLEGYVVSRPARQLLLPRCYQNTPH